MESILLIDMTYLVGTNSYFLTYESLTGYSSIADLTKAARTRLTLSQMTNFRLF